MTGVSCRADFLRLVNLLSAVVGVPAPLFTLFISSAVVDGGLSRFRCGLAVDFLGSALYIVSLGSALSLFQSGVTKATNFIKFEILKRYTR